MVLELNEADESVLREEAKQRGAGVLVGRGDERNFREHAARRGVTDARAWVGYGGGAVTTTAAAAAARRGKRGWAARDGIGRGPVAEGLLGSPK